MRSGFMWVLATLLVTAGPASAHLVDSGLGPFYDGVAHPFVTAADALAVVALALLSGLSGKAHARSLLFLLPAAWVVGALAGRMTSLPAGVSVVGAGLLVVLGVLIAAGRRLPLAIVIAAALTCGLILGTFNGATLVGVGAGSLAAVGTGCAVFVMVALVAGQVSAITTDWARLAVRVAGSWIGAVGLLMLGWASRS
jgi:urease accessory protein